MPFVVRQGSILQQGLTGNSVKDGDRTFVLDTIKDQLGDVVTRKFRRGLAYYSIMTCDFIGFGSLAFAIQLEDAMLDDIGCFGRNADEVNHRA